MKVTTGDPAWALWDAKTKTSMLMLDNEEDARAALAVAKRYSAQCFIGRNNQRSNRTLYIVPYWEGKAASSGDERDQDCMAYNPQTLRIVPEGTGWLLSDDRSRMVMLDNEADAKEALLLARSHHAQCFVGRKNRRPNRSEYIMTYWK